MSDTPNLALPYILPAQAQKHVTHNEAIRALDCLVQLGVEVQPMAAPPSSPPDGSRYLVPDGATGEWNGQTAKIAAFQDGAWQFYAPKDGWIAFVKDDNAPAAFRSGSWGSMATGGGVTDHGALTGLGDDDHLQYLTNARGDARYDPLGAASSAVTGHVAAADPHPQYLTFSRGDARYTALNPSMLGISAAPDASNRLAIASPASLFSHAGNGHQVKVNKNAVTDTASFLFQDNWSGRAEIGLTGDDNFHFKVSPDGSTFIDALRIDKTTGLLTHADGVISRTASVQRSGSVNNSATGAGAYVVHTPGFTIPASLLTLGRALRITAHFRTTSGSVPPTLDVQLRAGSTVLAHYTPGAPTASTTNSQKGLQYIVQALSAPSAASSVECMMMGNSNSFGTVSVESNTPMPVALATNTPLTLQMATQWSVAGTGTTTITLSQFIVEVLN